ncbi:hypothetical protein EVAR_90152_1 [Eumeta japonica]|uniref:Uncharacterized protein n=1 Tax=Eumeta variegata TaxID=151549 RepID=A0A4C1Z749_EUMVA|nr:hypothetical protein EVAR_90152_1 [Eumeta japonica]
MLPVLAYSASQFIPLILKLRLKRIEAKHLMALKTASGLPTSFGSKDPMEMLDNDLWHLQIYDQHVRLIKKNENPEHFRPDRHFASVMLARQA